jgi:hypothetical protein
MNRETQERQIQGFLNGKTRKQIDVFTIYQWIDRCYYEEWWDLALALAPFVPPNSLKEDYHKRIDFLLYECQMKCDELREQVEDLLVSFQEKFDINDPKERQQIQNIFKKTGHRVVFSQDANSDYLIEEIILKGQNKDTNMITINGVTYKSIREAARILSNDSHEIYGSNGKIYTYKSRQWLIKNSYDWS